MSLMNGSFIAKLTHTLQADKPNTDNFKGAARRKFESGRSERLFRILQYNHLISPIGLILCFVVLYPTTSKYLLLRTIIDPTVWWTPDSLYCVILGITAQLTSLVPFGYALGVCWPIRPFEYRKKLKTRSFKCLRICLVTRGENIRTILTTLSNWAELREMDERIKFHLIVDRAPAPKLREGIPNFIDVVLVPKGFQPPMAKYKARALEYGRIALELGPLDWVLHLDEETQIDAYVIQTCLEFIERGDCHFGMGTIFYNSSSHWSSAYLTVGEITRVTDDFGRFRLPFSWNHRPFLGYVHGSFILINGEVENAVTWDTDSFAEDFWFGYRAAERGYKFGWLNAIAREQPPRTIRDVCAQRKRWFAGIWGCNVFLARLSYFGCITNIISISYSLHILLIRENPLIIPRWVLIWGVICGAQGLWAAITSTVAQDVDHGDVPTWKMVWHVVLSFLLAPVFHCMECLVVINAILYPPRSFHVISKI